MVIEFDDAKDAANQQKHGVSLELMARFDLARMITGSARTVKGEPREWAMDTVDGAGVVRGVRSQSGRVSRD